MKKILLITLAAILAITANAYDFMVDGLCYNINEDGATVTVTYENESSPMYTNLAGDIVIPETATNDGTTYSVTAIGQQAFQSCKDLISVSIPNSVTEIGVGAFNASRVNSVNIPSSVTTIGNNAFYNCKNIKMIHCNLSEPIAINTTVFRSSSYTSAILYVPQGSVNLYKAASNWKNFKYIVEEGAACLPPGTTFEADGLRYSVNSDYVSVALIANDNKYSGDFVIPETTTCDGAIFPVTSIGESAFDNCEDLTSISIPNSVTSISNNAFYYCTGLTSVTIPNSVTSIGNYAFYGCSGLTSVTIGNSVTSIGNYAFDYCSGLTSVTIPNSVTSIGYYAFGNCSGLNSIIVDGGNSKYDSRNNCNAIIETESNTLITGCKNTIIPNSVTSIGNYAFNNCTGLTSVTIPNSVTSIGNYAFNNCTGLTSVTIGNSVTSIGTSAFYSCSGLNSIIVDGGNSKYDSRNNCNAIIETESNTLITGCKNTIIPNSVTSIGVDAFYGCTGLTSIIIPNSVISIGDAAFASCSGLTSIVISNSVEKLGVQSFYGCTDLESISLPNSLNEITTITLQECTNIKTIISHIQDPSTVNYIRYWMPSTGHYYELFEYIDKENCTLYVPKGTVELYQSHEQWSGFVNIVELVEGDTNMDGVVTSADITVLYDCLLNGDNTFLATDDVNGDGVVTSADITAVYDILLGN